MSTDEDISLAIVAYGSLLLKIIIIIIIINKGWSRFLYNMKSQPYLHQVHHPKKKKRNLLRAETLGGLLCEA